MCRMARTSDEAPAIDGDEDRSDRTSLSTALERLLSAGIGITARAIGRSDYATTLTIAQWRLLVITASREGPRVGELAAHLGISVPSASRLVRRLESRDLVTTARAEDDRRATIVSVTQRGRELVDDVIAHRRELIEQALHDRSRTHDAIAAAAIEGLAARMSEFV